MSKIEEMKKQVMHQPQNPVVKQMKITQIYYQNLHKQH